MNISLIKLESKPIHLLNFSRITFKMSSVIYFLRYLILWRIFKSKYLKMFSTVEDLKNERTISCSCEGMIWFAVLLFVIPFKRRNGSYEIHVSYLKHWELLNGLYVFTLFIGTLGFSIHYTALSVTDRKPVGSNDDLYSDCRKIPLHINLTSEISTCTC